MDDVIRRRSRGVVGVDERRDSLARLMYEVADALRSLRHWQAGIGPREESPTAAAARLADALREIDAMAMSK